MFKATVMKFYAQACFSIAVASAKTEVFN